MALADTSATYLGNEVTSFVRQVNFKTSSTEDSPLLLPLRQQVLHPLDQTGQGAQQPLAAVKPPLLQLPLLVVVLLEQLEVQEQLAGEQCERRYRIGIENRPR